MEENGVLHQRPSTGLLANIGHASCTPK